MIADSRRFVACDKCDFDVTLFVSATRDYSEKVYDFGGGKLIPQLRRRWWCLDCATVAWVERIPSADVIRAEIAGYKKAIDEFAAGKSNWPGKPLVTHYQSVLKNQDAWIKWADRRDGPRCLTCGCQQFVALDQELLGKGASGLGVEHPGCGGNLYAGTQELDYPANPGHWNYDTGIEFDRFSPDGFRVGNLRDKLDEEFPEIGPLFSAVVASEIRATPSRSRRIPGPKVKGEDEYPEICQMLRDFVRVEMRGGVLADEPGTLKGEFPELYAMTAPFLRREVARAKAEAPSTDKVPAGKKSVLSGKGQSSIQSNPFAILGATTRDDRRKIVELAEEKALSAGGNECPKARSDLTTPSKRLSAEVGWLPGLSPRQATRWLSALETDIDAIRGESNLPALASANLLAAAIEVLDPDMDFDLWREWIEDLAYAAEEIDPERVMREINEDRAVAGFPEVLGVDLVEVELAGRRKHYAEAVRNAFDEFEPMKLVEVVTKVVEDSTSFGEVHAPQLVHDIIERYEVEALRFLHPESENIKRLVEEIRGDAPKGEHVVGPKAQRLDRMIRNWDAIAQPIQLSAKAQGLEHELSTEMAWAVRSLAVDIFNKHDMLETSSLLSRTLREVFAELPDVAERLNEDAETLEDIYKRRGEAVKQDAEWARQITFRADVGMVFKDELSISPQGVSWKGRGYPLEAITRVRWGAVRNSVNGIPAGTEYTIGFGDDRSEVVVQPRKEATYSGFLEALWRAVCVRLIFCMAEALEKGRSFSFGDMTMEDGAVTLVKHKFLGNERVRLEWRAVHVWSANGSFVIGSKDDKKIYGSASYIEDWNTHLLEHIIRGGFKKGIDKLSDYLRE